MHRGERIGEVGRAHPRSAGLWPGWGDLIGIVPAGDNRLHDLMNESVGGGVIISESLEQDLIVYNDHAIGTARFLLPSLENWALSA